MNKFKLEFINPGYGFRNYKIGEITVYTVRLRFNSEVMSILKKYTKELNVITLPPPYIRKEKIIIEYETTDWGEMSRMRKLFWNICKQHAQSKLDRKYSQLKLEL
jgi:hypothetical protein